MDDIPMPKVHFLYDGCRYAQSDPKYRLDIWCACHEHFGSDVAAAVAHLPDVRIPPGPTSQLTQALARSVTGARSWIAQAQRSVAWLREVPRSAADEETQLEIIASFLERAAWVLHDPDADESRANEPQPHTPAYTQFCLACGQDHTEASAERLNKKGEGR